ncbi:hypothetical protein PV682_23305 [Streptomyces niveiscabiei]|uniref:hypothetical protein n=1 Tax=Streptomyces niveiscabiei TaxID=164115 RepID=UPI0029A4DF90|nr:hypothetical protein [Streptomyces niveiscabiei]MDX3384370.1 hypothetical protein [Streptomyces niveiscabiei]
MNRTTPPRADGLPPKPRMTVHVFTVDRYGRVTRDLGIRSVSVEPDAPPEPLPLKFPACACPRHRPTVTGVVQAPTVHAVRAEAGWFLEQTELPRHQTVAAFGRDFAACIAELIPRWSGPRAAAPPPCPPSLRPAAASASPSSRGWWVKWRE